MTYSDRHRLLGSLGHSSYDEYLKSPEWRAKRRQLRESGRKYACEVCDKPGRSRGQYKLVAHHRTYERLGCEELSDLVWLCQHCHLEAHRLEERGEASLYECHKVLREKTKPITPYIKKNGYGGNKFNRKPVGGRRREHGKVKRTADGKARSGELCECGSPAVFSSKCFPCLRQ